MFWMGRHAGISVMVILCCGCTSGPNPAPSELNSADDQTRQRFAAKLLIESSGEFRSRAIEILKTSDRCALWEDDLKELTWKEPQLTSELAWRWLRLPSLDLSASEILTPCVIDEERRELVDLLRRVNPEPNGSSRIYWQAVFRTPLPEDRKDLLRYLQYSSPGINGAAAGLVRLGDARGLQPFLEQLWNDNLADWGRTTQPYLPETEMARRLADIALTLTRKRFPDQDLRTVLHGMDPGRKTNVHAVIAHRLGDRAELQNQADKGVKEALRLLADYPGDDSLDILRRALNRTEEVQACAVESLALLGDPQLPAWIAANVVESEHDAPWSTPALTKKLKAMAKPLPATASALAEEAPEGGKTLEPLPVFADWWGIAPVILQEPAERVIVDPAAWTALCRELRRPAPALDFTRHAAIATLYVDPDPNTINGFDIGVAGMTKASSGTVVHLLRRRSALGMDAVDHAGTFWRILIVPRTLLPLRFVAEDVVIH